MNKIRKTYAILSAPAISGETIIAPIVSGTSISASTIFISEANLNILNIKPQIITSSSNGDIWHNPIQNTLNFKLGETTQSLVSCIFTQTASTTVTNSLTDATLIGTGKGSSTLSAGFLTSGKEVKIAIKGYHTKGTGNIIFKFKIGSTTIISTGSINSGSATLNVGFQAEADIVCRTIGTNGTVIAHGWWQNLGTGALFPMITTATTTINTTIPQDINATVTYVTSNAKNSMTSTNVSIQLLN